MTKAVLRLANFHILEGHQKYVDKALMIFRLRMSRVSASTLYVLTETNMWRTSSQVDYYYFERFWVSCAIVKGTLDWVSGPRIHQDFATIHKTFGSSCILVLSFLICKMGKEWVGSTFIHPKFSWASMFTLLRCFLGREGQMPKLLNRLLFEGK